MSQNSPPDLLIKVGFPASPHLCTTSEAGHIQAMGKLTLVLTLSPVFSKRSTEVRARARFGHLGKELLLHNFLRIGSLGKRVSEE